MAKYYHTCTSCGANLDPGERCDCDRPLAGSQTHKAAPATPNLEKEKTLRPPVQR